ncbi:MAG: thioredoxin [Clostridia bacterium]|nr:thioredoxin [Clostridia bacterium]
MSVKVLTDENFEEEVIKAEKTVLVDFFATWCGPCKIMAPVVEEIAAKRDDIKVCKLDVDEGRDTAINYGIMSIPTLMVFKNGEVTKTFVGVTDESEILAAL